MRIIIVVAAGLALAGCSSTSMPSFGGFKSDPPAVTVQLESLPIGAEAKTSTGQTCKTPCSLSVPAADGFSVTFSAPKFQPETVPVLVVRQQADGSGSPDYAQGQTATTVVDPNPVYAELKPAGPQKKGAKTASTAAPKPPKAKKPKASVAPAADDSSPFPPPPAR